jgi:REP element-mobilizing transposase RayT
MPKKDAQNSVGAGFKPALSTSDEKPRRKRLRLPEYDYSSVGMYFITICAHQRMCLFGRIVGEEMRPNRLGIITEAVWYGLPDHYPHVELDSFIVMPNHVHGIIALTERSGSQEKSARRHSLAEVVRAFKTFSSRQINQRRNKKEPVWQRNHYEHVIRNEESLSRIRGYIETNSQRWQFDRENPNAVPAERGAGLKPAPTGIDANPGGVPPNRP